MANAGYSQPGAIPVATPVPAEETVYLQHSTVVATNAPPAAPSSPSQQRQNFGATDPTLARVPMMMRQCPRCRQESRTRVTTKPSWQTWLATGALCLPRRFCSHTCPTLLTATGTLSHHHGYSC
eukprot:CAMPEP_0178751948 /NCGR_PEP_ID=MMETSP0744-20121128/10796_1 /TAXON_ID=913974 /ORGANISM="Nitzschia punctata, Strain CCMP561" /LENGTH=123 /DNA_ID=CAMNT_0020405623 /DNA_START=288 /DNA_END=659 /DNA_ORIENTATION=-